MADRAKKFTELTATTSVAGDAVLVLVQDPSGTPATRKITVNNLLSNSSATVRATMVKGTNPPSTANSTGTAGEVRYDSNYAYFCVSDNTWKRVALSTW